MGFDGLLQGERAVHDRYELTAFDFGENPRKVTLEQGLILKGPHVNTMDAAVLQHQVGRRGTAHAPECLEGGERIEPRAWRGGGKTEAVEAAARGECFVALA